MKQAATEQGRLGILAASYASLAILALVAFLTVNVHVGALAVVPILFIAYYLRPFTALVTAFITGVVLALLDNESLPSSRFIYLPPFIDALVLSLALCAVVLVANRMREMTAANEALRGSLLKARRAADHDALTGIANRAYFMRSLTEAIALAHPGDCLAVLFCDLDRFKSVNDRYGHSAGDGVLKMAAQRLSNTVRSIDVTARMGGDEFGVIARRIHDSQEATHVALQIEHAFADPFQTEDRRLDVGITIGISLFPDDGNDAEALLHAADARMYRAKQAKHYERVTT